MLKKKLLLTTSLLFLFASCSEKSQLENAAGTPDLELPTEIVLDAKNINILDINDPNESEVTSFGQIFAPGQKSTRTITLINRTSGSISFPANHLRDQILGLSPSAQLTRNTCDNKNIRKGAFCQLRITLEYDYENLATGDLIVHLGAENSSPTLQIVVDIDEKYHNEEEDSSDALSKSREVLNYGIIQKDESRVSRVYIANSNTSIGLTAPSITYLPPGVSIENDTCGVSTSPVQIRARRNCFFEVRYTYQGVVDAKNVVSDSIQFSSDNMVDKTLDVQAINTEDVDENSTKLVIKPVKFPEDIVKDATYGRRMYISNPLNFPYTFEANEVASTIDSNFTIQRNTCDGKTVGPKKFCYLDLTFTSSSGDENLSLNVNLPNANAEAEVKVGKDIPNKQCNDAVGETPDSDLATLLSDDGYNLSNVASLSGEAIQGTDIAACAIATCEAGYELAGDSKSCQATVVACSLSDVTANGGDVTNALTAVGDVVALDNSACLIATCDTGHQPAGDQLSCETVRACEITDLTSQDNVATVLGQVVAGDTSTCLVETCNANYDVALDQLSCEAQTRACLVTDLASQDNVSGAKGTVVAGDASACLVDTCNTNYNVAGDELSCEAEVVACTETDAQTNGWTLGNGTISGDVVAGDVSACELTCDEGYAESNKVCQQSSFKYDDGHTYDSGKTFSQYTPGEDSNIDSVINANLDDETERTTVLNYNIGNQDPILAEVLNQKFLAVQKEIDLLNQ